MSHDVFVSYSTDDKQVADTLVAALEQQGIRCWYAPRDIRPGADWGDSIFQGIVKCEVFLLVFSGNSNRSHRVLDELNLAIEEEKIILPFRIENINPSGALRLHLTTRHWLDAYDPSWDRFLDQLVENVGANLKKWRPGKSARAAKPILDAAPVQPVSEKRDVSGKPGRQADQTLGVEKDMRTPVQQQRSEIPSPRKKNVLLPFAVGLAGVAVLAALVLRGIGSEPESTTPAAPPTQAAATATAKPAPTATEDLEVRKNVLTISFWSSGRDGMDVVYVPAGDFNMGATPSDVNQIEKICAECRDWEISNTLPQHTVYVDAFWIDRTEVSNEQYRRCVADGACTEPMSVGNDRRNYWNDDYWNHPVVNVSWQQANDYCLWVGRRLPTEAEWEKAARGKDGRLYPWGDEDPADHLLNYWGSTGTKPVGSYPDGTSPYGVLDMAGNVWEWTADWYAVDFYSNSPSKNPTGPNAGSTKVLRGGSWGDVSGLTASVYRHNNSPDFFEEYAGFRCVDTDMSEISTGRKMRTIDDMHLLFVPGGEFLMGSQGDTGDSPLHRVELDAFYIDEHEVTVWQYKQCERNGPCTKPVTNKLKSGKIYYGDTRYNDYPVINVTWDQAQAYCQWVDRRLPTEAEWEKAARGTDGRKFPWGDEFDGTKLNFCDVNCVAYDYRDVNWDDGFAETSPTGSFPQGISPYDAFDLAGNVWEWVADWYAEDYYSQSPTRNPPGPDTGSDKVLRGGCWGDVNKLLETSFRLHMEKNTNGEDIGFRCATDFNLPE